VAVQVVWKLNFIFSIRRGVYIIICLVDIEFCRSRNLLISFFLRLLLTCMLHLMRVVVHSLYRLDLQV